MMDALRRVEHKGAQLMRVQWSWLASLCLLMPVGGPAAPLEEGAVPIEVGRVSSEVVQQFFGEQRGDYILPGRLLHWQVAEALSGTPDPTRRLADGLILVSGCRYQSCIEKAAVVSSAQGRVLAIGLIHHGCHPDAGRKKGYGCARQPIFTVFVPIQDVSAVAVEAIRTWGRDKGQADAPGLVAVAGVCG
jgi:hypothetical protein